MSRHNEDLIDRDCADLDPLPVMEPFLKRIDAMNRIMEIEYNTTPTDLGVTRVDNFHQILRNEVDELQDVPRGEEANKRLVAMADFLGDLIVYAASEARRWGIPILPVLHLIMDSQNSKLVDGKPVKDETGKFIKGPNYVKPEPAIERYLERFIAVHDAREPSPYSLWVGRNIVVNGESYKIVGFDPVGHHGGTSSYSSAPWEPYFNLKSSQDGEHCYLNISKVEKDELQPCD